MGQPVAEIWTRRLQELLGDRYCVVNFAFRGASASDGGALVAEVLRGEFPRQIYVANAGLMTCADPLGTVSYRFLFWEAYFKGLLMSHPPRNEFVRLYFLYPRAHLATVPDIVGKAWLDGLLHFDDLWNYLAFDWINTVPSFYHPDFSHVFVPRDHYADDEPDFRSIPFEERYPNATFALELQVVRGSTETRFQRDAGGHWVLDGQTKHEFNVFDLAAMPAALRQRTLIVVSQSSPYYVDKLTPDEKERDALGYRDSIAICAQRGLSRDDLSRWLYGR